MDPSLSFHRHCNYVSDRIDKRNNMLKALAGSSWGQDKETLLLTYNALGKSIASYAAPVWSTNASDSSFKKSQGRRLRYAFCAVPCELSGGGPRSHGITFQEPRPRPMKDTLHSRHHSTILPPRTQQSIEEASTSNIGRGAETQPKTTMHSLTTTVRKLPSIT